MQIDEVLKRIAPKTDSNFLKAAVNADAVSIMQRWGLTGSTEQAQLIAQMAAESGGFRIFAENLNYSAERLHAVFPKYFPSVAAAEPFAHNPKGLALRVYNARMGNRPASNDGYDYRGSNALQHTGRAEFERVQKRTGDSVVDNPDRLRDPSNGMVTWNAACSYFVDRGALAPAKAGQTRVVTQKVNGGLNGLSDREEYLRRTSMVLSGVALDISKAPATKTEQVDNAEEKRKTAQTVGAGSAAAGGAATSTVQTTTQPQGVNHMKTVEHWVIVGCVVIGLLAITALVVSKFKKQRDQAQAELETQQLTAIKQKVEDVQP